MRRGSKAYNRADKAQQAMLAAVSIYNSPVITFKSEICISLICTAWTYLLHAYCDKKGIEVRQLDTSNKRRTYKRNDEGDYLILPLKELANLSNGLIDESEIANIEFIAGIRNRIQHSADASVDALIAPKLQANIMNFRQALLDFTEGCLDIAEKLNLSLQFAELSLDQTRELLKSQKASPQLSTFIAEFETRLDDNVLSDIRYSAKVRFELENKSHGKDAYVVNVLGFGDEIPEGAQIIASKEVEKPKYRPGEIVRMMKGEGYMDFSMQDHTLLWKELCPNAKNKLCGYGTEVSNTWYWYEKWINEIVRPYCQKEFSEDK